jgi:hypothetical protein
LRLIANHYALYQYQNFIYQCGKLYERYTPCHNKRARTIFNLLELTM